MHPAPSVILFTALSGLGFGLLAWLGAGFVDLTGWAAFGVFFVAYALSVGGLLASTAHLGNPQRAFKAFRQWRSSWLSREAWVSVAALLVMGIYALAMIFFNTRIFILGCLGAGLSIATVLSTSMIYTSLRTVPRWNQPTTPAMFFLYAVTGGALLGGLIGVAVPLLVVTGAAQLLVWHRGDSRFASAGSTMATATGLGETGNVRLFEAPHSGSNYLTREMVFQVGRKHSRNLRIISVAASSILPALILSVTGSGGLPLLTAIGLHMVGLFISRWLFFAEAEHVVGLYYGAR